MKVLFISRANLQEVKGGDTTQVYETAKALRQLGIEVDIRLAHESGTYNYDLIHFFNLIRPADLLEHLSKTNLPLVISPIYVDYSAYDRSDRKGLQGLLARNLNPFHLEYLKTIFRVVSGQQRLGSFSYLRGHKQAMKTVLKRSQLLLPNSESEAQRIKSDFKDVTYCVVPNAIDDSVFYLDETIQRNMNQVICVGQFDGRKNQHRLIHACRSLDVDLILVGKASPNNSSYLAHCKAIANDRVRFIDFTPQEKLRSLYNQSAVHILPSWFETTGLTSLEAAACGCKIVVSEGGDTRSYFDGFAHFCEPESVESIRSSLLKALDGSHLPSMIDEIQTKYTWKQTAKATLAAYQNVLS